MMLFSAVERIKNNKIMLKMLRISISVLQAPEVGTICLLLDKVHPMTHSTLNMGGKPCPYEINNKYK